LTAENAGAYSQGVHFFSTDLAERQKAGTEKSAVKSGALGSVTYNSSLMMNESVQAADKDILIAEDEHFLQEILRMLAEENGQRVRTASNGEEAIRQLENRQPDVMLLDLLMPVVDGYAVLRHVHKKGYRFPVIVLSNLSDSAQQAECIALGAKAFLVKSNLDEDELWRNIETQLKTA
jgi:CheY-like chemotaxis protein